MTGMPNGFNPSDYQYLLKSVTEGNIIAKAQSLKRLNALATTDKKQFGLYAKRVVLAIQELLSEQKEDVALLATMLVLEIINLNPKDIQYYVRTKLLKYVVVNLGDPKPQLRKTSHYFLLAYVKTFKTFDDIIVTYTDFGITSPDAQLRQKAINSFQSILITEAKHLNWNSSQFRKIFQLLLHCSCDESPYVQKAAQQCLLSIVKFEEINTFTKKLPSAIYTLYKLFCQNQRQLGNLEESKIEGEKSTNSHKIALFNGPSDTHRTSQKTQSGHSMSTVEKSNQHKQEPLNKKAIIDRIQQIRRNSQIPKLKEESSKIILKKPQIKPFHQNKIIPLVIFQQKKLDQKDIKAQEIRQKMLEKQETRIFPLVYTVKTQKIQNVFGKKLLQDIKNQKEWKVRLQAIEELQAKFQLYKEAFDVEALIKKLLPTLTKLLADQNFKIALISLKIIEELIKLPGMRLEALVPQMVEKLGDNKIALRQNVSKLIRAEYLTKRKDVWIDNLLDQLKRGQPGVSRQEILNVLTKLYEQQVISYNYDKVVEAVCPMMDDLKTKIKIRTLDFLVLITIKTQRVDHIKALLMSRLNQVYYEMYLEKVGKQLKNNRQKVIHIEEMQSKGRDSKSTAFPILKAHSNNSPNNTTSTSLQKYSRTIESKSLNRASSLIQNQKNKKRAESQVNLKLSSLQKHQVLSTRKFQQSQRRSDNQGLIKMSSEVIIKKTLLKSHKKKTQKTFQSKITTSFAPDSQNLKSFFDPDKELKNLLLDLKSEDWQVAFEALTKLRRILYHHTGLLSSSIVRGLIPDLMKHVESLRSSLSKNAVTTLHDLSNTMKRQLDTDLELIFSKLMRKTLDANSFISEEVRKALLALASNSYEGRVLTIIFSFHTSRALPIKQTVIYLLQNITFLPKVYEKQLERIIQILVKFMGEGSLEIRQKTNSLMLQILDKQKPGSRVYRYIPGEVIEKLKGKNFTPDRPRDPSLQKVEEPKKQKEEQATPGRRKRRKILLFPVQFNYIQGLLEKTASNQWKTRQESMMDILRILKRFPEEACQHKLTVRVIEVLSKQANDPNSKVAVGALGLLRQICSIVPLLLEIHLGTIVSQIFGCFGSQRIEIRETSLTFFDTISDQVQKWMLLQHLCNGVLYGVPKSKVFILGKLIKILPDCVKQKPQLLQKSLYGLINKVAEEGRPELIPSLKELVGLYGRLAGQQVYSQLKQRARTILLD